MATPVKVEIQKDSLNELLKTFFAQSKNTHEYHWKIGSTFQKILQSAQTVNLSAVEVADKLLQAKFDSVFELYHVLECMYKTESNNDVLYKARFFITWAYALLKKWKKVFYSESTANTPKPFCMEVYFGGDKYAVQVGFEMIKKCGYFREPQIVEKERKVFVLKSIPAEFVIDRVNGNDAVVIRKEVVSAVIELATATATSPAKEKAGDLKKSSTEAEIQTIQHIKNCACCKKPDPICGVCGNRFFERFIKKDNMFCCYRVNCYRQLGYVHYAIGLMSKNTDTVMYQSPNDNDFCHKKALEPDSDDE